jgi:hypothetical protein
MEEAQFEAWPKIPRHKGVNVIISEKFDGTNSAVIISGGAVIGCQSRNRLITPENDNFGFARWAHDNSDTLSGLGDGRHFGEWAGPGIQKNPHNLSEKTFFLFNTSRYDDVFQYGCSVVPVLFAGEIEKNTVSQVMSLLSESAKAAGYKAEGIIIYHVATRSLEKVTFENSGGKWAEANTTKLLP